ncbi:MAG: glycosyltransferase family 2 protein [Crenarchaeota archaeon]|nr:glycosyltransferase family 2 protein [Thermoproteota archaeon]
MIPKLAIIVPTVQSRLDLLNRCLTSLLAFADEPVTLIVQSKAGSFAQQCNYGAYSTATAVEWLLFVNDDVVIKSKYLVHLYNVATLYGADVIGAKLLYPDDTIQHIGVYFSHKEFLPYHPFLKHPQPEAPNVDGEVPAVTGAFLMIKKKLFTTIGGFDTKFENGFEDVDLCLRCREAGAKIAIATAPIIYHYEKQSRGSNDAKFRQNLALLKSKWPASKVKLILQKHQLLYTIHNTLPKSLSPYSVAHPNKNDNTKDMVKDKPKKDDIEIEEDESKWPYNPTVNDTTSPSLKILIHVPIGILDQECMQTVMNLNHGHHFVDYLITIGNPIPANYDDNGKEANIQTLYENVKYKFGKAVQYALDNDFDYILNIEHDMIVKPDSMLEILKYANPRGLVSGLYRCRPTKNSRQPLAFTIPHPKYPNRSKFLPIKEVKNKDIITPLRNICYGFTLIGREVFENHVLDGCDGKFSSYCYKNKIPMAVCPKVVLGHKDRDGVIIWP